MGTKRGAFVIEPHTWLPPLVTLGECGGNWNGYLDRQYGTFKADFLDSKPGVFRPKRWAMKSHPLYQNKEATFWHVISTGLNEDERTPDMRRMERVDWIRLMIDHCGDEQRICCWNEERSGRQRPNIAIPDFSYLVVLEEREDFVMLWTAIYIEDTYKRGKLKSKWEAARKGKCRP